MNSYKMKFINLIIMAITLVIIAYSGIIGYSGVKESLHSQEINNLQDVAEQNSIVMERALAYRLDLLSSIATMMRSHQLENNEVILQALKDVPKIYGMKRIGFIRPNGMAFTTDGYNRDLSFREFFVSAMRGNRYVSKRIINSMGDPVPINVFSVPVYNDNGTTVVGVLFATYETSSFRKIIAVPSFAGNGYCFVVDAEGNIIVDSEKSPYVGEGNLVKAWSRQGEQAAVLAKTVQNQLLAKQNNYISITSNGQKKHIYYLPLKTKVYENTLYLLTIVPEATLLNRLLPVANALKHMLVVTGFALVLSLAYIFFNIHRRDKELYELAYVDTLTGDMNYTAFKKRWKNMERINGYIVALDVERFDNISQILGSSRADELLKNIWCMIKKELTKDEMIAHVDQDEFVLLLCANSPTILEKRIEGFGKQISEMSNDVGVPELHAVFGIYAAQEVKDVDAAYNCSVQAKNAIKGKYGEYCSYYNDKVVLEAKEKQQLADSFSKALDNKEFDVWYQPKIDTVTEKIIGAEALVRWYKKDGSIISPAKFIPVFESNGMIAALDEYVFRMVCQQQHGWLAAGKKLVPVSVNVSRASLRINNLVERYVSIANQYSIEPQYLQIEITESSTISDENINECLQKFHDMGFKLLLDDFGSGYSSLVALYRLPFDVIKLDKSLIDYVEEAQGGKLVKQMIQYSKSIGLTVTAEGVESKTQLEILRSMDCDAIQGYYFDKPLQKGRFAEKYLHG